MFLPVFVCLSVCLSVSKITQKGVHGFGWYVTCRDVKASRPKFWPQSRNLWPWPRDPLGSASSFWSRPRTLIFNFKEPGVLSFRNTSEPPWKKETHSTVWSLSCSITESERLWRTIESTYQIYHPHQLWQFWLNSWILCTLQTLFWLRIIATSISAFVLCASRFCSSRESLLSEWTYHVFTPITHVKCCARMPGFLKM